ncbi:MAG: hypothetical protein HQK88_15445 [Nitrospirae bacterium]|nr:hypothetical protein [Nitrospirota bacterium]MBF0536181.1 hypothetical protein [Nitrospirota bacterium]MBF0618195.1 hypothetical protein [Nitrospirota bacterium]
MRYLFSEKTVRVVIAMLLFLLLSNFGCVWYSDTPTFTPFDDRGWGPNAITWNGRDFIIGDRSIYYNIRFLDVLPVEDFSKTRILNFMLEKFPVPIPKFVNICGLAWEGDCCDNGYLWIADSLSKEIFKLSMQNNSIVKTLLSPGDKPNGLAFDGEFLWVADAGTSKIYKISPATGKVTDEFFSPVREPTGLSWDCAKPGLWVLGHNSCNSASYGDCVKVDLVKLNVKSGKIVQRADLPSLVKRPSDVVWVDGDLWVSDYIVNRIYRITSLGIYDVKDDTVYKSAITAKRVDLLKKAESVDNATVSDNISKRGAEIQPLDYRENVHKSENLSKKSSSDELPDN